MLSSGCPTSCPRPCVPTLRVTVKSPPGSNSPEPSQCSQWRCAVALCSDAVQHHRSLSNHWVLAQYHTEAPRTSLNPRIKQLSGLGREFKVRVHPELRALGPEPPGAQRGSVCRDKSFPLISIINYFHTLYELEPHANSSEHSIVISVL